MKDHHGTLLVNKLISFIGGFFRKRNFVDYQLQRMEEFSIQEILKDSLARLTFRKYLGKKYEYGTKIILILWECYIMCEKIKWKVLELNDITMKKLSRACPAFTEEGQLMTHLKIYKERNDTERINIILDQIELAICERIEECYAHKMFIHDIKARKRGIREIVGEIYESLEDVKSEMDDFLLNLMGNSINV